MRKNIHRIGVGDANKQRKRSFPLHSLRPVLCVFAVKKIIYSALLMVSLSFLNACKEEPLPEEIIGEPTFYFQGDLGGASLDLQAGIDDYYMWSAFEKDDRNVHTFTGEFKSTSCGTCPNALRIGIRDFRQVDAGEQVDINSALQVKTYPFYFEDQQIDIFRVSFNQEGSSNGNFVWDFGDGGTSSEPNPVHDYSDSLNAARVCLASTDPTGCTTTICNTVKLADTTCQADFIHELDPQTTYVRFQARSNGKPPLRYRWDFGDGFGASLGNPGYFYRRPDRYRVCLTVTDADQCSNTICKNITADPALCESNFTYKVKRSSTPDPLQLSTVLVRWRDANGKVFRSDLQEQPSESSFRILSVSPYEENEAGNKTMMVELEVSCLLFAEDGEKMELKDGKGVIAVAWP